MIFGTCFTTSDPHPSLAELKAERAIGITHKRLTVNLAQLCAAGPDPLTWAWDAMDSLVTNIRAAGMTTYFNPGGCPPWASEGQPAFVGLIPGTAWWNAPHHRDAAGNVDEFLHGIHFFDQDPNRPDQEHDALTGALITGPELAAIDQQQPPRPYLVNPPKMNANFFQTVGFEIMTRYTATLIGVGNEYGGEMYNPWVRKDISRDGSVDMIREHLMPEMILPFFLGAFHGAGGADGRRSWKWVGPDADSASIMQRCLDAGDTGMAYDVLGGHMYGDVRSDMDYATTAAFLKVAKKRTLWCTEIDADANALIDWSKERAAKKDIGAIFYLTRESVIGSAEKFAAMISSVNGPATRRRAVRR